MGRFKASFVNTASLRAKMLIPIGLKRQYGYRTQSLRPNMNGHVLIVTEKPDAAYRIALALDYDEKPRRVTGRGAPYYIAKREKDIVIVPSLGHLYTIAGKQGKKHDYPAFSFDWVPKYKVERSASRTRGWLKTFSRLAENADEFIDACDYDVEGCLIGFLLLKHACGSKENVSKRMKFSTLTKHDLLKAYLEQSPQLDFGLVEAGRARHEVDWLYGVNLSRAMMNALKKGASRYATLTTGRVQGPTLKFLVEREEAIRAFVPVPYWQIGAKIGIDGNALEMKYEKERIERKKEAEEIVRECQHKKGRVEKIEVTEFRRLPPFPFDLAGLQSEAYNLFKYPPRRTLSIAQHLYLRALISYPRTDSQKLPATIDYKRVLKDLGRTEDYAKLVDSLLVKSVLKPNEGRKTDPAHPAIYPTGNLPERILETSERQIWDLIVRRFLATFAESAVGDDVTVRIAIARYCFNLSARRLVIEGWMSYCSPHVRFEETMLPHIEEGQEIDVKTVTMRELYTQPPYRYNSNSLLKEMERAKIGTKATRAEIIQTLHNRGYVQDERMTVTDLGSAVLAVLQTHCPPVISIDLTRELETKMERVMKGREKREAVVSEAKAVLEPALFKLKQDEKAIGLRLGAAIETKRPRSVVLGTCPTCGSGQLIITCSRKTRKRFVGCTGFFNDTCKTSFPLPQKGVIKSTGRKCPTCGWPTVEARHMRHRWILCVNTNCSSKRLQGKPK